MTPSTRSSWPTAPTAMPTSASTLTTSNHGPTFSAAIERMASTGSASKARLTTVSRSLIGPKTAPAPLRNSQNAIPDAMSTGMMENAA